MDHTVDLFHGAGGRRCVSAQGDASRYLRRSLTMKYIVISTGSVWNYVYNQTIIYINSFGLTLSSQTWKINPEPYQLKYWKETQSWNKTKQMLLMISRPQFFVSQLLNGWEISEHWSIHYWMINNFVVNFVCRFPCCNNQ